ncbi:MAG: hypothetical protein ABL857_04600 [Rickettsiales bacterium]
MKNLMNKCVILQKCGLVACLILLSACNEKPAPEYPNSGDPERLLDFSLETVTFGLDTKKSLTRLSEVVAQDRPTSAELRCSLWESNCAQAREIFERNSVPISLSGEKTNDVMLSYERVVARDCESHFIDNMRGGRSFNHPSFGCATAGNIVQMVGDKRQFTSPSLLGFSDAEKQNQSYREYSKPSSKREFKGAEWNSGASAK